jgi:hypothetical protein
VFGALATEVGNGERDEQEDPVDPDEQQSGRPRPDVERDRDPREHRPPGRSAQGSDVTLGELLVDGFLAVGDGERDHDDRDCEHLEERLGGVVVGKPRDRPREERARRERKDRHADDAAEPAAEALAEEVRRDRGERPEHRGREQQDERGRLSRGVAESDGERRGGDELVVQRAELADGGARREAGPRVEGHRPRPVLDRVPHLPEMIPRVVAAEVDLAVDEEALPVADPDPEHEPEEDDEKRDVVPRLDAGEHRAESRESLGESLPALTHCLY